MQTERTVPTSPSLISGSIKRGIQRIVEEEAAKEGITAALVLSGGRSRKALLVRHRSIIRCHQEYPEVSYNKLGSRLGVDHTTILFHLGRTLKGARRFIHQPRRYYAYSPAYEEVTA